MADHLAETGVAINQLLDLPIDCLDVVLELIDRLLVPFVGQRGLHVFALDRLSRGNVTLSQPELQIENSRRESYVTLKEK